MQATRYAHPAEGTLEPGRAEVPRRGRRLAGAVAGALAVAPLLATPAAAHTSLVSSAPAADAAVEAPPADVQLVFTEAVSQTVADVVVTAPSGGDVAAGDPQVAGDTVTQPLQTLEEPGSYTVAYRVVAADGHPVTGTVSFTLAASAAPSAGPTPSASPEPDPSTTAEDIDSSAAAATDPGTGDAAGNGWLLPAGLALVAVLGVLGIAVARRGRRSPSS